MATMTSRERVLTSLRHEEPDRVPVDIGGTKSTSVVLEGAYRLAKHLGVSQAPAMLMPVGRIARLDEDVMRRLGSDCRPLIARGPSNWSAPRTDPSRAIDEWGVTRQKVYYGDGAYYWEIVTSPLAEATINDLDLHSWPDPLDPGRVDGLADEAQALHAGTDYAVCGDSGFHTHWETAWALRGFEQLLLDVAADPAFVHALMAKILEINKRAAGRFLDAVGPYIDVFRTSDDIATQRGLLMSPDSWRKLIRPYFKEYVEYVRSKTDARIFYHSCGNVTDLVEDLADIGVDVLNPVQVGAMGDLSALKARYGSRITFWGGVDTQRVLPVGTVPQVEDEVRIRIRDLAPGGGYVLAAVHNIQPDVPPENVVAMADAARAYGTYPISAT
jgi:uroporphyrinogen decarboxylase